MKKDIDEKLIKQILQKGTEIKAPKDLSARILDRWQLEEERLPSFAPVFPRLTWWILGFFFSALFIWGFSKMSFTGGGTEMAMLIEQFLENLEYTVVGLEEIVFPTTAVLVIMVLINSFLLRYRCLEKRVLG